MSEYGQKLTWETALSGDATKGDMGAAGPIFSKPYYFGGKGGSIQYKWPSTNAPVGTIALETSNNHHDSATGDFDAVDETLFDPAIEHPAGTAGTHTLDVPAGVANARLKYARTSGGATAGLEGWAQRRD